MVSKESLICSKAINRRRFALHREAATRGHDSSHPRGGGCTDWVFGGLATMTIMTIMIISSSSSSFVSAFSPQTSTSVSAKTFSLGCRNRGPRVMHQEEQQQQQQRLQGHSRDPNIWSLTGMSTSSRSRFRCTTTRLALSLPSSPIEKSAPAAAATVTVDKGIEKNPAMSSAELMYAEADRIRNEAAAMELNLTISKIETIEGKLNNPVWLKRQSDAEQSRLRQQLEMLQKKLPHTTTSTTTRPASPTLPLPPVRVVSRAKVVQETGDSTSTTKANSGRSSASSSSSSSSSFFFANKPETIQKETVNATSTTSTMVDANNDVKRQNSTNAAASSSSRRKTSTPSTTTTATATSNNASPKNGVGGNTPYSGFDDEDLALYLPVALKIEALCKAQDEETLKIMANASTTATSATTTTVANLTRLEDKLRLFREAPELQSHFQAKITSLLTEPLQDMQDLQTLREKYLSSNSRVERQNLKRKIQSLEKKINSNDGDGRIAYSDSIHVETNRLSEDEIQERLTALRGLPPLLQGLYLKRTGAPVYEEQVDEDSRNASSNAHHEDIGDLRLAIELEHYESQMQLLEQIKLVLPLDDERKLEAIAGVRSLPLSLRLYLAKKLNINVKRDDDGQLLDEDKITTLLIKELTKSDNEQNYDDDVDEDEDEKWSSLMEFNTRPSSSSSGPVISSYTIKMEEYNDVDFIDRSQYVEQLYTAIARLEGQQPRLEEVHQFMKMFDNKKTFMVTSKPERVIGGYYIRGENLIANDTSSGTKLVQRLTSKLKENSTLSDKLDFFFIPDPAPLLDEEIEMEYEFKRPILVVTGKKDSLFYASALPETKAAISALGVASLLLFSVATVEMQPNLQERLDAALSFSGEQDLTWFMNTIAPVLLSVSTIHLSHELAHRIVAWRDDFRVGWSTLIPSVQIGLFASITPIRSPPPSMKSLFDFALAGPLIGLLTSLIFLISGLSISSALDTSTAVDFPALPVFLLRSSALGGGLIEFFLGKGAVLNGPSDAVLPLHPFAIAGFTGLIMNALALIPFGNTDGGRVSTAMFGRSATYLAGSALAILLSIVGLFGADEARILLTYVLFSVTWQSELEPPARNEVEEVDLVRGACGIATGLIVALILCPLSP